MSIKKSIGWTDMTINPIKGRCKGGCWYCYYSGKRGMLDRFKQDPKIRFKLKPFYNLPNKPKKIFLCSTHDLFGSWVFSEWRDMIFEYIELYPQHTFQILTKFPQNIDREMPENVFLGITIDGRENTDEFLKKETSLYKAKAKLKFVSYEPLLGTPRLINVDWVIAGKLTGFGKKYDPPKGWIEIIVEVYSKWPKVPIFLKDNLIPIMGKEYVMKNQEFPKEI